MSKGNFYFETEGVYIFFIYLFTLIYLSVFFYEYMWDMISGKLCQHNSQVFPGSHDLCEGLLMLQSIGAPLFNDWLGKSKR